MSPVKLSIPYDFRVSGDSWVRFDSPITLMGKGCPSTRVGGRRSSEEWSRSDETCADIEEGLRPNQRLGCRGRATECPACSGVRDARRAATIERRMDTATWIRRVGWCRG